MNTVSEINDAICRAARIIAERVVKDSAFDKTIRATVVTCLDLAKGKYQLKYQDLKFEAYAMSYNAIYPNGTNVYVLVPNNDMGNQKVILGSYENVSEPNIIQEIYWSDDDEL